jgi:hypothetical protein
MASEKQAALVQAWVGMGMFAEDVRLQQQFALSLLNGRYATAARGSGEERGLTDREHRARAVVLRWWPTPSGWRARSCAKAGSRPGPRL